MGKLLEEYLGALEKIDAKVNEKISEHGEGKSTRFLRMVVEAEKGKIRADLIEHIGPLTASMIVKKLEPDFTFEDFLAELDRVFGPKK